MCIRDSSGILRELWNTDVNCQIAFRDLNKFVPRLRPLLPSLLVKTLSLQNSDRFALTLPKTKNINDLKFNSIQKPEILKDSVEVEIQSAGLNFKDILSVLKPTKEFNTENTIGADFAGIVTAVGPEATKYKIGDNVFGCSFDSRALPSHTIIPEDMLISLPNHMTYSDGATLPCVFATAYHCLISVGKLKKHENVLIHTATGGVGLCAIQIANQVGANIIAL